MLSALHVLFCAHATQTVACSILRVLWPLAVSMLDAVSLSSLQQPWGCIHPNVYFSLIFNRLVKVTMFCSPAQCALYDSLTRTSSSSARLMSGTSVFSLKQNGIHMAINEKFKSIHVFIKDVVFPYWARRPARLYFIRKRNQSARHPGRPKGSDRDHSITCSGKRFILKPLGLKASDLPHHLEVSCLLWSGFFLWVLRGLMLSRCTMISGCELPLDSTHCFGDVMCHLAMCASHSELHLPINPMCELTPVQVGMNDP